MDWIDLAKERNRSRELDEISAFIKEELDSVELLR